MWKIWNDMKKLNLYLLFFCFICVGTNMIKSEFMSEMYAPNLLKVASASFVNGGAIPTKHGYKNDNSSVQISWSAGPKDTKSYVLICQDPDASRMNPWVHWIVFNIPVSVTNLNQGVANRAIVNEMQQGLNDYKTVGWGGPNPPSGIHRYYFYVYALDSDLPELKEKTPTKFELMNVLKNHNVIAQGQLMGTFKASK